MAGEPLAVEPEVKHEHSEDPMTPTEVESDIHLPTPLPSGNVYRQEGPKPDDKVPEDNLETTSPSPYKEESDEHGEDAHLHLMKQTDKVVHELDQLVNGLDGENRLVVGRAVSLLSCLKETAIKNKSLVSHYEFQNKILTIQLNESSQRHEVENSLVKREVDRLKVNGAAVAAAEAVANQADIYRRRLQKAKVIIKDQADELAEKNEEISRLKAHIRESRSQREAVDKARAKYERYHSHGRNGGDRGRDHHEHEQEHDRNDDGLAALGMLATQVLNQERRSSQPPKEESPNQAALMSPVELSPSQMPGSPEKRRRESSASTITIPSDEEGYDEDEDEDEYEDEYENEHEEEVEGESEEEPKVASPSPKKYIRRDTRVPGKVLDFDE